MAVSAPPVTVAVCTYNRAAMLPRLVEALRGQECDLPMRILVVNNNSTDETAAVLDRLATGPGTPLQVVVEPTQGIVPARNRAIEESRGSEYLFFIDDDELPGPSWVRAGLYALRQENADCAGGRVSLKLAAASFPGWFSDDLRGFLGENDHGSERFWVRDEAKPVWTGNIAYRTAVFQHGLRFDLRYSRSGKGVGGGEDVMMLRRLLERGARIRYVPDMVVEHLVENWRLKRSYFLRTHYASGRTYATHEMGDYPRAVLGVPLFLFGSAVKLGAKAVAKWMRGDAHAIRHTMNFAHAVGMIVGCHRRWRHPEHQQAGPEAGCSG